MWKVYHFILAVTRFVCYLLYILYIIMNNMGLKNDIIGMKSDPTESRINLMMLSTLLKLA